MNKRLGLLLLLIIVAAGVFLLYSVLRDPEEASAPIEAVPLESTTEGQAASVEDSSLSESATDEIAVESSGSEAAAETGDGSIVEKSDTEALEGELRVYQINQRESQVRFELDEDLRGQRTKVIGITDQVAGELGVNLGDLSDTQVGVILINARTLKTDNDFRNRAINNQILDTADFEFITFTPTSVNSLPVSAEIGQEISFTIEGELTIRNITQPATFEVVATAVSETQLVGQASTVVTREDFDLRIPNVPSVANVEEEVELFIDFVADAS